MSDVYLQAKPRLAYCLQPQPNVVDGGLVFPLSDSQLEFCQNSSLRLTDDSHRVFLFNFTVINRGNIPANVSNRASSFLSPLFALSLINLFINFQVTKLRVGDSCSSDGFTIHSCGTSWFFNNFLTVCLPSSLLSLATIHVMRVGYIKCFMSCL